MTLKVETSAPRNPATEKTGKSGPPIPTGISGKEAIANQEVAFDAAFTALPVAGDDVQKGALMPDVQALDPQANVAQALGILGELESKYLTAPPKGKMSESFDFVVDDDAAKSALFAGNSAAKADTDKRATFPTVTLANVHELAPRAEADADLPPDLKRELDAATDKLWDKALASIPSPETPAGAKVVTVLATPEGARIMSQLTPVLKRISSSAEAGATAKVTDSDKKVLKEGVEKLSSLAGTEGTDVMALVMLVLMEIHRDRGKDIKDLVEQMRLDNRKKAAMREEITSQKKEMARMETELRGAYQYALQNGDIERGTSFEDFSKGATILYPAQPNADGSWPKPQVLSPPPDYMMASASGLPTQTAAHTSVEAESGAGAEPTPKTPNTNGPNEQSAGVHSDKFLVAQVDAKYVGNFVVKDDKAISKTSAIVAEAMNPALGSVVTHKPIRVIGKHKTAAKPPETKPAETKPAETKAVELAPAATPKKPPFPPPFTGSLDAFPPNMKAGSLDEMKTVLEEMQNKMDAMGDITMENQQRLQMLTEPFMQTSAMMSNLLKKEGDTANNIVGNLK